MIDLKYRPDIDGLRAVAVVMVLLFHAGLGFSGGFVGVDVFFVISGFLITGLILKRQKENRFRLADFWGRRIRRILPASIFTVVVTVVVASFFYMPNDYAKLGESALYQQLMVSNYYFWQNTGYFDGPADLQPLLHTWSLAVEEQFYLIYPFLLFGMGKFSQRKKISILGVLFIASLICSEWSVHKAPTAGYFMLHSRAWEMLLGGLICFLPAPHRILDRFSNLTSVTAIGTILACGWYYEESLPFPGLTATIPCLAAALLIYVNSSRLSWPGRLLSSKPVVFVGLISYSLYLVHWPILAFLRYEYGRNLSTSVAWSALGLSLVLACLSWRFIEQPFRKQRWLTNTRSLIRATVVIPATLILFTSAIQYFEGIPQRLPERSLTFLQAMDRTELKQYMIFTTKSAYESDRVPAIGDVDGSHQIAVWGDSHAMHLMPGVDQVCQEMNIKCYTMTFAGCPPLIDFDSKRKYSHGASFENNQAAMEFLLRSKISTVLMVAWWSSYANDQPENFQTTLHKTINKLTDAGISVVILEDVAQHPFVVPTYLARQAWRGEQVDNLGVPLSKHRKANRRARKAFRQLKNPNVRIYDPTKYFLEGTGKDAILPAHIDGIPMFVDQHHLTVAGAERLKPLIKQSIRNATPQTALVDDSRIQ